MIEKRILVLLLIQLMLSEKMQAPENCIASRAWDHLVPWLGMRSIEQEVVAAALAAALRSRKRAAGSES